MSVVWRYSGGRSRRIGGKTRQVATVFRAAATHLAGQGVGGPGVSILGRAVVYPGPWQSLPRLPYRCQAESVASPKPAPAVLDEAIIGWLRDESDAAFDRLSGLGQAVLYRAVGLYYGHSSWAAEPVFDRAGREIGDAWSVLLGRLAQLYPDAYLEQIEARRIRLTRISSPTSEVVILGLIADPRAVALLAKCARHRDWLVRYHAVQGLVWRDDPEAVAAVDRAAREDCSVSVRCEAAAGVARRDPARAIKLYTALLEHPHLTPMLRKQVKNGLAKLNASL